MDIAVIRDLLIIILYSLLIIMLIATGAMLFQLYRKIMSTINSVKTTVKNIQKGIVFCQGASIGLKEILNLFQKREVKSEK